MKFFSGPGTWAIALMVLLALAACQAKPKAVSTAGGPAALDLKRADGTDFDPSTLKGKVVLIEFWATWCPPCKMAIPDIKALSEKVKGTDIEVVTVAIDDKAEDVSAFVKENNLPYLVLHDDGRATKEYGVRGVPTSVVLDKTGKVVETHMGYMTGYADEMLIELKKYL